MNFVADEGVDSQIVKRLRENGHNVYYIVEQYPGLADENVLKLSNQRKEVLIAQDKDFGELVYRLKQIHSGIILIRLSGIKPRDKAELVAAAIDNHLDKLQDAFTVINKDRIKIRKENLKD